jgi:ABC-2 type transport system permease protein
MKAVFRKEMADYFSSVRCLILFLLVIFISAVAIFAAYTGMRGTSSSEGFVFLRLFSVQIPNFPLAEMLTFINFNALFFIPIIGITLGFDAINSEHSGRTMSRILSQPLFRDGVINGKFLAATTMLSMMVAIGMLLISGFGLRMIGVPPTSEEIIRLFLYLVLATIYGAFWVGLAMLFSILFRSIASSLLTSLAFWLFVSFGIYIIALAVPQGVAAGLRYLSPSWLCVWGSAALIQPQLGMGLVLEIIGSTIKPSPLSLGQSLLMVWPDLVILVSLTAVCFAVSYVVFMRQEIRAA